MIYVKKTGIAAPSSRQACNIGDWWLKKSTRGDIPLMCRCQMWGVLQSWGIPVLSSWMTILGNLHNPRMILSMIFIGYKNLHDIIHDIYDIRKPPFPWMTSMILSMIFIGYISYISMGLCATM